jgi:hypothetical protein
MSATALAVHHTAVDGEKHIADVKTERGYIECQHSALSLDERVLREAFYPNLVWVVHGRRALDLARFSKAVTDAIVLLDKPRIVAVAPDCCPLLRKWSTSRVPVYFDFGENEPGDMLWRLGPGSPNGWAYLLAMEKSLFLNGHLEGQPLEETCTGTMARAAEHHSHLLQRTSQPVSLEILARTERSRGRL